MVPGAVIFSVIAARVTHLQLKIFVASVEARSPFVDLVGPAVESVSLASSVHETVKWKYAASLPRTNWHLKAQICSNFVHCLRNISGCRVALESWGSDKEVQLPIFLGSSYQMAEFLGRAMPRQSCLT